MNAQEYGIMMTFNQYDESIRKIRTELKSYIKNNKLESLVIGISGGIDSALVAALAAPVCTELNIPLIGRYIHIETNKLDEMERAKAIGKHFCHNFNVIDLTEEFYHLHNIDDNEMKFDDKISDPKFKIRKGNIKARLRMMYLYNLASMHNGLVMSTDNLTELLLGFWTLHGDVGDLGIIQQLWKTEVYQMTERLINFELYSGFADTLTDKQESLIACIKCNATDGLGISSTDLDQIMPDWKERHTDTRSGYGEVDLVLYEYLTGTPLDLNQHVIARYEATHFKRLNPINFSRSSITSIE